MAEVSDDFKSSRDRFLASIIPSVKVAVLEMSAILTFYMYTNHNPDQHLNLVGVVINTHGSH